MKIVLFDSIAERHLVESMTRALKYLGHQVYTTGWLLHGHELIKDPRNKKLIWKHIEKALAFNPQLFVSLRPMNLSSEMLDTIKNQSLTAVWLSDDPVLYKICYSRVVNKYDIMLNCGSNKVIEFYVSKGHTHGVNFPFWTDHIAFPPVYNPETAEYDVVFLGNMQGSVRKNRYLQFAKLPYSKKIYGNVDEDPLCICGGYIKRGNKNSRIVSKLLSKFKVGVSFPQYFINYQGTIYDFPELSTLGNFQIPSRIIQYMASGLPVATLGDDALKSLIPEINVGSSMSDLEKLIYIVINDNSIALSQSNDSLKRFRANYTSLARAQYLLYIANNLSILRKISLKSKMEAFRDFAPQYDEFTY